MKNPSFIGVNEAGILLIPKKEHCKAFEDNSPMIRLTEPKSLKYQLVSAKIKCESSSDNTSVPRSRYRCQICPFIEETNVFRNKDKILNVFEL